MKCPYCAEEIQPEAIKCKHCGEWLQKPLQTNTIPVEAAPNSSFDEIWSSVPSPTSSPAKTDLIASTPTTAYQNQPKKGNSGISSFSLKGCLTIFFGLMLLGVILQIMDDSRKIKSSQARLSQGVVRLAPTSKPKPTATPKPLTRAEKRRLEVDRRRQERERAKAQKRADDAAKQKIIDERVKNNSWDGAVPAVVDYLKATLNDFNSAEWVEWSETKKNDKGYVVRLKYRAKNGFGGLILKNQLFFLDKEGNVTNVVDL